MNERLGYSAEEAAKLSGIGRTRIFAAISNGRLIAHKFGRRTIILHSDLERFLASLPIREPIARDPASGSTPAEALAAALPIREPKDEAVA
ncbi:helix-turn-helix domain-containing protein [Mesorhizobium kowhaii]|uniref:Helix-turn-helix domain-containing protein n=1 Tax=Mesorhizobium kowhaii TaxID=1300272 RepID=A0A2W7C3T5_9HYPH|nr:helix-turn-helix domain-containing protein [Mesorhizobium kowhaii]PZV36478.1 hypothetical protein B5V02_22135 [Mesorhizobium kowhaii]